MVSPLIIGCDDDRNQEAKQADPEDIPAEKEPVVEEPSIKGVDPSKADAVILAPGLAYEVLLRWGDPISEKDTFGFNNDFLCFVPTEGNNEGILWSNHEYIDQRFIAGSDDYLLKSLDQVNKEMYNVGGSLVHVRKEGESWKVVKDHPDNKRITGHTMIPFNWDSPVAGATEAMGTLGNCSGGITPWGTILTCEENYDSFYGETVYRENGIYREASHYKWEKFHGNPPEHYGWVVEVDPKTGDAQKHVAIGRFAHECATMHKLDDGRMVVYSGDDSNDEFMYKFIGSEPNSMKEGTLYVANLENGEWISLDYESNDQLKANFKDQTDVLVRARTAARMLGATPLDRPEDIEIDPNTGNVLVALTNNLPKGNYHGSILQIKEQEGYDGLRFEHDYFLTGGPETGFSCPDNMAFDNVGNLWFTSDISGSKMDHEEYLPFGNNGLFLVPNSGPQQGEVIQIASAPVHAEFTGPWFSPDGRTLFLSVQHPGEGSKSLNELTSNWPDGGDEWPRPSVITIQGELLDRLAGVETA